MILVFAGAGASKAVNSINYPTTVDFFEKLPLEISKDTLFANIVSYLKESKAESQPIDIEEVLWALQQVQNSLMRIQHKQDILEWLLVRDKLTTLTGINGISVNLGQAIPKMQTMINSLTELINCQVYSLYNIPPTEEELKNNWINFLEVISGIDSNIQIFTTNYDFVIETALKQANLPVTPITGRTTSEVCNTLDLSCWDDLHETDITNEIKQIKLTKLHGSIDWIRNSDGKIGVGNHLFSGNHENHILLYPGFKDIPQEEPFSIFHNYFEKKLLKAEKIIFIGFAFRDDYINKLLENNCSTVKEIIIVDPNAKKYIQPFLHNKKEDINMGFDKESVSECMRILNGLLPV